MKNNLSKKALTLVALCVMLLNITPQKVEAKAILDAFSNQLNIQKDALKVREQKLAVERDDYAQKLNVDNPWVPNFIEKAVEKTTLSWKDHEIKNVQKAASGMPALSNPVGNKVGEAINNLSTSKVYDDFKNLSTGSELTNNMSDKYFAAVGSLPKFQDINVPTSLSLIKRKAPKTPSVAKYSFRLPAPSIDKASLQDKFVSGINTDDEMTAKAVEKFKTLHNMGN